MIGRAHMATGMCIAIIIGYFWNKKKRTINISLYWFLLIGAFAGNFPDIDYYISHWLGNTNIGWSHRSIYTHSLFGLVIWPILIALVIFGIHALITRSKKLENLKIIYFAAFFPYISHLVTDLVEDYPTPILYPFTSKRYYGFVPEQIWRLTLPDRIVMSMALLTIACLGYHYYFIIGKEKGLTMVGWLIIFITTILFIVGTSKTIGWFAYI